MLVLSRQRDESIFIGDNICITVVDIDRGKIRLGIEAPRDVAIYRQELLPHGQLPAAAARPRFNSSRPRIFQRMIPATASITSAMCCRCRQY